MSEAGDQGYPGEVMVAVTFLVTEDELIIDYHGTTTKATPLNLTNHAFYNLSGHVST